MGEFRDGEWIPDGAGPRRDRLDIAKRAMQLAHRGDRPIEQSAGEGAGPTHRAARQFAALTHSVDPDDISPADISSVLEHQRRELGHDDAKQGATATSALNARLIDELAEDTDDNYEAISARSYEDDEDADYEDDEDAAAFDWLEETYEITADELAEHLQGLEPEDAQATADGLGRLYELHQQGYGTEAAEQILLAQLNSDTGSAESYGESYGDDGDAEEG